MNFTDEISTTAETCHPVLFTNSTTWISYLYLSTNAINIILGLAANCYVVLLILTGKGTGFVLDLFSLNLAVCEILFCLGTLIAFNFYSCTGFATFLCFICVLPMFGRPLFLCLICVERYAAVVHPIIFLKFRPPRYRLACCAVVWMIVAGFGVFCLFILSSNDMYTFICVVLPQYLLFLSIKLFCCLAVLRALKHPGPGERGKQREEANRMKRRAMKIILIITVAMVIQYTPLFLAGLCYALLPAKGFLAFWAISVTITMIVAFVQPVMYIQRFGNLTLLFRMFYSFISVKL